MNTLQQVCAATARPLSVLPPCPSLPSVLSTLRNDTAHGIARPLMVRPSRRSPSGWCLVVSFTGIAAAARAIAARYRGCLRCRSVNGARGSWFISLPVSGVAGVPPAAVERLAGVPVVT